MNRFCAVFVIGCLFFAVNAHAGGGHAHGPDGSHVADTFDAGSVGAEITLSSSAIENIGIQSQRVSPRPFAKVTELYGRVISDPRRVTQVEAQFDGTVEKVFVLPGEFVQRGDELLRARPIQVGSQSKIISASAGGFVTELFASRGMVFEQSETLLELSDLSAVLFEGDLFDSTKASGFETARSCSVKTKRYPDKKFDCRVETVDARLRGNPPVGHVHASIQNTDFHLKPGMTGQIFLSTGEKKARLLVPKDAVLGRFEQRFLYERKGQTFTKRSVEVGDIFGDLIEIKTGIKPGAEVVTQGHYQLQYSSSSASGDDHAHEHGEEDHKGHDHDHHGHEAHEKSAGKSDAHDHEEHEHDHDDHDHHGHSH